MNAIRQKRQELGLTQTELAQALGVTQGTVSQWEAGLTYPMVPMLVELAKALKCSADDLLRDDTQKEDSA